MIQRRQGAIALLALCGAVGLVVWWRRPHPNHPPIPAASSTTSDEAPSDPTDEDRWESPTPPPSPEPKPAEKLHREPSSSKPIPALFPSFPANTPTRRLSLGPPESEERQARREARAGRAGTLDRRLEAHLAELRIEAEKAQGSERARLERDIHTLEQNLSWRRRQEDPTVSPKRTAPRSSASAGVGAGPWAAPNSGTKH